eukprot:526422-Prymnesium_polylepis.1
MRYARGDDNMRCTMQLRDALLTRSHEEMVRSHGCVRSHRGQSAAAQIHTAPDTIGWFTRACIAE